MAATGWLPAGAATEFQVNTFTTSYQMLSSASVADDGAFVVVWTSYGQDGAAWGVFGQRYDSTGAAAGTEFQVNTFTTSYQAAPYLRQRPGVATAASGDFVVVWDSAGQDGSTFGVFAQRFSSAGVAVGGEFQVNTWTTSDQIESSVAAEDNGDFVVTWTSFGQDAPATFGVFGQRYSNAGAALGTEFRVNGSPAGSDFRSRVAMDADGDFVVVWMTDSPSGTIQAALQQRGSGAGC